MGYVFISYRSIYRKEADAMRDLFTKNKIDCWMAPHDIPSGSNYAAEINDAIENCACFVLLLTKEAQTSRWVKKEVNLAITYDKTIITAKLDDAELISDFKFYLNDSHMETVESIDENNTAMRRILKAVSSFTGTLDNTETSAAPTPDNDRVTREPKNKDDNENIEQPEQSYPETQLPEMIDRVFGNFFDATQTEDNTGETELPEIAEQIFGDTYIGEPETIPDPREEEPKEIPDPREEEPEAEREAMRVPNIGSSVFFGRYKQSDSSNRANDIEWIVLDKKDGKALLISKYALDCKKYNSIKSPTTWATCELRAWLNGEFFYTAFSVAEQDKILTTIVPGDKNPLYGTNAGNATYDKVFLLSIPEAEKYFGSKEERRAAPTAHAIKQGAFASSTNKTAENKSACNWWLRSPGKRLKYASCVYSSGYVYTTGERVNYSTYTVRPALWIDIASFNNETANNSGIKTELPDAGIHTPAVQPAAIPEEKTTSANNIDTQELLRQLLNLNKNKTESTPIKPPKTEIPDIGASLFFGKYRQSDTSTEKEAIEWIVLDKKDGKALLISKYALDCKKYNSEYTNVTWASCTLRKWLNGEFLHAAFSAAEQERIVTSNVPADKNPMYATDPGNATYDKIFLLSIPEAEKYFGNDEARRAAPTKYAIAQGAYVDDDFKTTGGEATCWWWLRSSGYDPNFAAYVNYVGSVDCGGSSVSNSRCAVRPALWISLGS